MIRHLSWDSHFFGKKIGAATFSGAGPETVQDFLTEAHRDCYELVYVFSSELQPEANQALAAAGAQLADRKVTFGQPVPAQPLPQTSHIKLYQPLVPNADLYALALQSGTYSRFATDPRFKRQDFERLYHVWIEEAAARRLAREILIYEENGKISGLLTLGEKQGQANIGLLAVDGESRGRNIGAALVSAALDLARTWGFGQLQVVTQEGNPGACRFYENNGFRLEKRELVYHYWLP